MSKIEMKNCVYKVHPVYDLYAANDVGDVINIVKKESIGYKRYDGYIQCNVRKYGQKSYKMYYVHRFVWECFSSVIPGDKVIDHINNTRDDNRLCNLQLVTQSENSKKSVKDIDYSYLKNTQRNAKYVKATNCKTNDIIYFNSMYCCVQYLNISNATIKRVCDGVEYRKSGISKKDGCSYKFEYVKKEDMPDNYIKSANIRPKRVSDEDKKKHQMEAVKRYLNKEFVCPRCNKTMKNNNKSYHNKKCK